MQILFRLLSQAKSSRNRTHRYKGSLELNRTKEASIDISWTALNKRRDFAITRTVEVRDKEHFTCSPLSKRINFFILKGKKKSLTLLMRREIELAQIIVITPLGTRHGS